MLKKILSLLLILPALIASRLYEPARLSPVTDYIKEEEPLMNEYRTSDKIIGNNSEFYIVRPVAEKLNAVHSSDFGMDESLEDNTDAFISAVKYLRDNPCTKLIIDEGKYYFSRSDRISFDGVKDCFVEGTGAEFIFGSTGTFFNITHCDCLEINGLAIDVDRVNNPVDDVLRIRNADKKNKTLEFVFFEKDEVSENMIFSAITQCDPETLTFGAENSSKEHYIYQDPSMIEKVEKIAPNVLKITHNGAFGAYEDGDTFILRHHVYDGQVFSVYGETKNLTFNNIKIYGSYGSGFGAGGLASHYQIINSTIGVDPDDKTGAHVSQGADGIHIAGSGGFFNLENCDISGQGDDAVNIHDGIGYVFDVQGNTVKMYSTQTRIVAGEALAFKDTEFNDMGYEAVVSSFTQGEGTVKIVTFDKDVSANIKAGCIAYSTVTDSGNYVIRNNYFHENRARALLLQSDNGLCENNRFFKAQGQAIKIVMDIRPALWQEGTGVNNLIIRGNTFDRCDYSGWGEQITIDSYIDGHFAECFVFRNIEISGNTFTAFPGMVINAMNVNGLKFTGNRIDASSSKNFIRFHDYCDNVTLDNEFTGRYADIASIVKADKAVDFILLNR